MTKEINDDQAVKILSALAQSTRFGVFKLLMKSGPKGLAAGVIADRLSVPQNTLSSHLNILVNAGIISCVREGRSLFYKVEIADTRRFMAYLTNDCCNGHPELCSLVTSDID